MGAEASPARSGAPPNEALQLALQAQRRRAGADPSGAAEAVTEQVVLHPGLDFGQVRVRVTVRNRAGPSHAARRGASAPLDGVRGRGRRRRPGGGAARGPGPHWGHPTAGAGPRVVAARRRERVGSVIEGEELPVSRLAPKRPAEPTPAQQLASLIDWPPTMADLEMMAELRLSQLVTRKRPVEDC